jgi:type I restriction enzyme R subunit
MLRNEAQTRHDLIDPALEAKGWKGFIRVEHTLAPIDVVQGQGLRRVTPGRLDYLLVYPLQPGTAPVPLAIIEAKHEGKPPDHGLQQGQGYRLDHLYHVPFVFASNGHLFVCFDSATEQVSEPLPLVAFPTPAEMLAAYAEKRGLNFTAPEAALLYHAYVQGVGQLRYYQDAAIRAALEQIWRQRVMGAACRVLLTLATGSGKTRLAAALLRRLFDAGFLTKALFLCDRTELRDNGLADFQNAFGNDAAEVDTRHPQKNARVIIATYQTMDHKSSKAQGSPSFYQKHYPPDYFDVIVIDECHRSAWGEWRGILDRNPAAIQIGLTATPREIRWPEPRNPEQAAAQQADARRVADNVEHFGPAVYDYPYQQGVADGFLAPNEIEAYQVHHDNRIEPEHLRGVTRDDLQGKRITHLLTGQTATLQEAKEVSGGGALETRLHLPDRVRAMCQHLFQRLLVTGGGDPRQKTIVFCASDAHADAVSQHLNTLYHQWAITNKAKKPRHFAFKCMSSVDGRKLIKDFRGQLTDRFIATTKDLLSTGVDVPGVRNIVFFRYLHSPILFTQMVGRGTRVDAVQGKLMFRIFDYTGATALFGAPFTTPPPPLEPEEPGTPQPPKLRATGFTTQVASAGTFLTLAGTDGRPVRVTPAAYQNRLISELLSAIPTLEKFRDCWMQPDARRELLHSLQSQQLLPEKLRETAALGTDFDLFDVLASLAYAIPCKTKAERAAPVLDEQSPDVWLHHLPQPTQKVIRAIARQFERGGTDAMDTNELFKTPEIRKAGGLKALKQGGDPTALLHKLKEEIFVA